MSSVKLLSEMRRRVTKVCGVIGSELGAVLKDVHHVADVEKKDLIGEICTIQNDNDQLCLVAENGITVAEM